MIGLAPARSRWRRTARATPLPSPDAGRLRSRVRWSRRIAGARSRARPRTRLGPPRRLFPRWHRRRRASRRFGRHPSAQLVEQALLEPLLARLRRVAIAVPALQFRRHIAFGVGQRLFADVSSGTSAVCALATSSRVAEGAGVAELSAIRCRSDSARVLRVAPDASARRRATQRIRPAPYRGRAGSRRRRPRAPGGSSTSVLRKSSRISPNSPMRRAAGSSATVTARRIGPKHASVRRNEPRSRGTARPSRTFCAMRSRSKQPVQQVVQRFSRRARRQRLDRIQTRLDGRPGRPTARASSVRACANPSRWRSGRALRIRSRVRFARSGASARGACASKRRARGTSPAIERGRAQPG